MGAGRLLRNTVTGLAVLALAPWVLGMQSGQSSESDTTGKSSRGSIPSTNSRSQPDNPRFLRQLSHPIFITGAVVQEDGSPLPSGAVIERICGGHVSREATVDSSGHFSFQVGGQGRYSDVLPDASEESFGGPGVLSQGRGSPPPGMNTGFGSVPQGSNLMGCELRAQLAGYHSSTIILSNINETGQNDVGVILVSPRSKVMGTLVSATDMTAPKAARKALESARKAAQKNRLGEAETGLKRAVDIYPKFAAAWFELGQVYQLTQRTADARTAYRKALEIDSMYVRPYIQLAQLAVMEKNWQEALDLTEHALTLDPLDFPEGYFFNSLANYRLQRFDAAERGALKAERLDPQHRIPQVHLILADIMEQRKDVAGAIGQLQAFLKFAPQSSIASQARSHMEDLQRTSQASAGRQPGS